ncbi:uncharacterized protein DNG_07503 [Cephalotrichum gorgonifer]|uniref:Uncharacterized protein n=1 Tax=Cephalotrichum gorgonifer TaxID=2041049 RepID=A0AAE8N3M2_9PEZI|nr:uncharacterized protein DNG_07503 [Cephalotrichum gorgonifer]
MGRMSRFNFPIPGRKKSQPSPAEPQPEVHLTKGTKAQQLLGATGITLDNPAQWDVTSNSGISISVSETTASHHPSERLADARKEAAARGRLHWDQESDTVPPYLKVPGSGSSKIYNARNETLHEPSEVSSVRRKGSNSTITSYYDPSSVPLSVSQQTSASAMAKGLPTKASTLLDIGGTMAYPQPNPMPTPTRKTKPNKLDISHILSRPHSSTSDQVTINSPPARNLSHKLSAGTLSSLKSERRVTRKSTRERLYELTGRSTREQPIQEAPTAAANMKMNAIAAAKDKSNLNHLYDHYEQMSFKQVLEEPEETPQEEVARESEQKHASYDSVIRDPHPSNQYDGPGKLVMPSKPAPASEAEYAASISSRHTRTSKGSKKTTPSFIESDLHHQSVLSLSSDSEEDDGYVQLATSSPRPPMSRNDLVEDERVMPMSERRRSTASKSSETSGRSGKSSKRASFASKNTYLTIPNESLPPRAPDVSRRSSSLAHRTPSTPTSSLRSSRISILSTSTTGSISQHLQEARMNMSPAQHAQQNRGDARRSELPAMRRSTSIRSDDQLTPPLSPHSTEFSVRPPEGQEGASQRFMAVTKQEEMLLAALRLKRARMRGNAISELEEEDTAPLERKVSSSTVGSARDSGAYAAPVRAMRKKGSKSSVSTIVDDRRPQPIITSSHSISSAKTQEMMVTPLPPIPVRRSKQSGVSPSVSAQKQQLELTNGSSAPRKSGRARRHLGDEDVVTEEPNPDLSDFMEYGNTSDETDGQSSLEREGEGDKTPVTPSDVVAAPSALGGGKLQQVEEQPVIGEVGEDDDAGVPRPDSPISPHFDLFPTPAAARKRAVRLSAVGGVGREASWWGHDG